jgi:hypothetical protein
MNLFNKLTGKKNLTQIDNAVKEVLNQKNKNFNKTFALVSFHKSDKSVFYFCGEIIQDAIKYNGTYYYVNSDRIFETKIKHKKNDCIIPIVDLYEGITVSYTPYKDIDTRTFSEVFQDVISLHIEKGILENKRKTQINLRKAIAIALIGGTALFIFGKMFFGA